MAGFDSIKELRTHAQMCGNCSRAVHGGGVRKMDLCAVGKDIWLGAAEEPEEDGPSMDWKRRELNEYAESLGISNPGEFPNKAAVLAAIAEAA